MTSDNLCREHCIDRETETNFVTRCGHHFHTKCLQYRSEYVKEYCPICEETFSPSVTLEGLLSKGESLTDDEKRVLLIFASNMEDAKLHSFLSVYIESLDLWDKFKKPKMNNRELPPLDGLLYEISSNKKIKDSDALPIWYGLAQSKEDPIDVLLNLGSNIGSWGYSSKCFFAMACRYGHLNIVKILLDYGVDPEMYVDDNSQIFHIACEGGHLDVVKALLKNKGQLTDPKFRSGIIPLISAAQNGNIEVMRFLLDSGADIDLSDFFGGTALSWAHKNGHMEACQFLLSKGADFCPKSNSGNSLLSRRCDSRYGLEFINKLKDHGLLADWELLYAVCMVEDRIEVKKVIERGADVNYTDKCGNSELHHACRLLNVEIVSKLISSGADVNLKNRQSETPISTLCEEILKMSKFVFQDGYYSKRFFIEISKILLDAGASMKLCGSVLFSVVRKNHYELLEFLFAKGADINVLSYRGDSLLHEACKGSPSEFLKKLFALKCSHIIKKNCDGDTPLHILCKRYRLGKQGLECLDILIEHGADINCKNDSGETPLTTCIKVNSFELSEKLRNLGAVEK